MEDKGEFCDEEKGEKYIGDETEGDREDKARKREIERQRDGQRQTGTRDKRSEE